MSRFVFFFQAEDGIRDGRVTGVQTCALPISRSRLPASRACGWVAVQAYRWRRKLAKRVVVIAVADAGVGFRHSLEPTQSKRFGTRWGDAAALEAALIQGVSRFRDPGRGQGLAGIRRYLARWDGKIAILSGTARIAIVPKWDDDVPLKDGLPPFPGAQVLIIIPEPESTRR